MYLHALLEQTEWLCEVADAKLVSSADFSVTHFEVKPLLVAFCVRVHLAEQVIFLYDNLFCGSLLFNHPVIYRIGFNSFEVATFDR